MTEGTGPGGTFEVGAWGSDGVAELRASGPDAEAVLAAGLRAVAEAATGGRGAAGGESAAAIRGQGGDLAAVFAELAADLLAQLDANGPGLSDVRLDGLLATDDGGFTAWGYLLGTPTDNPPPVGVAMDGLPTVAERDGGLTLRVTVRRG